MATGAGEPTGSLASTTHPPPTPAAPTDDDPIRLA